MFVTMQEILDAREVRVRTQAQLREKHGAPLICFTMNIAGPVKTSALIERAFQEGVHRIDEAIGTCEVLEKYEEYSNCGPAFFCVVKTDAKKLKKRMVKIEETHPVGRLFDIDVIDKEGQKLTRPTERGCMICGAPGRACAAGRTHPVSALIAWTNRKMSDFFVDFDAKRIARIAKEGLLREVYTAPKPGLVDPLTRGSHTDMAVADFERSAEALEPYFADCVRMGSAHREEPCEDTFLHLRKLGVEAEKRMYAATRGVNTHKGAIFSMGILAGAVGRLIRPEGELPTTDEILAEAAKMSQNAIKRDLEQLDGSTAGGRAYLARGMRGIRGEVADGFQSVKNVALPAYRAALASGKNENDAGILALLHLIANVYDTNLYKRGGEEGLFYAREYARSLLAKGSPTTEQIQKMDTDFTARNLSPGGCADLLAVTYFLAELEDKGSTS